MNFVLAAGGTGGHMIPAHALAAELTRRTRIELRIESFARDRLLLAPPELN